MAGTLVISTLSDGTNSTSSTNCIQGSAKAWVNFNGSGGAIRASYNVSSITVNGTGNYYVNFTSALADANYSAVVTCDNTGQSTFANLGNSTISTTRFGIFCIGFGTGSGAFYNAPYVTAAVFR